MIGLLCAAALLASIGLLCVRRIDTALLVCALQGLVAAASLGKAGFALALLAFSLNAVALPIVISRMDRRAPLTLRGRPIAAWGATLVLLIATVVTFAKTGTDELVAAGVSVTLVGFLMIVLRSHPLAPVVGLLSSQNGVVLVASAHADLPVLTALTVAIPFIPAILLANEWLRQ